MADAGFQIHLALLVLGGVLSGFAVALWALFGVDVAMAHARSLIAICM